MFSNLKHYLGGILGPHVNRKLIVIHSDDWGAERMPSNQVREKLAKSKKIDVENPYCYFDTLESEDDLDALFEILTSISDINGRNPVISANCLLANPDFEKIEKNNFEKYYYHTVKDTFIQHNKESAYNLWLEGFNNRLFVPQFHGREHVNVHYWLEKLREKHEGVSLAFENKVFGASFRDLGLRKNNFQAAWDFNNSKQESYVLDSIKDGIRLFQELFNMNSKTAVAPSYTWSKSQENLLKTLGVEQMQGLLLQKAPSQNKKKYNIHNRLFHQHDLQIRNVFFEPSLMPNTDIIDSCIERIRIAFQCKVPAIISSHRVNFIGGLNERNRIENLVQLKILLTKILKVWPDVEFISSEDLVRIKNGEQ